MNESQLQKIYNYPIYPRNSKLYSEKGFVNIDNGSQGGIHWVCFIVKDNKSFFNESFGGQPDNFSLNHLPKPIIYHNFKIQDINSNYLAHTAYTFSIWLNEWIFIILL